MTSRDEPGKPEVQGHRGYGDLCPHNSLAAFRAAGRHAGVGSVEFDVRRSADGHLVVTHGPENGPYVERATLSELRGRDLGGGERVPLLSDVVDACMEGDVIMNVELKSGEGLQNVTDTLDLLRRKGALPRCRISSFDRKMLQKVIELAPEVPIGALYHPGSPVDPTDESKGMTYTKAPADFASWFERHLVAGDSVNLRAEAVITHPELIAEARRRGKQVMAWCPCKTNPEFEDGEAMYRRLIELGVDVICCNRPDILAKMLGAADATAEEQPERPRKCLKASQAEGA